MSVKRRLARRNADWEKWFPDWLFSCSFISSKNWIIVIKYKNKIKEKGVKIVE